MTNKERQKCLDFKKFEESANERRDKSGSMEYCEYCECSLDFHCIATQEEREKGTICAKAYNKMVRKNKKK